MTLKNILIGTIAGTFATTGAIAADLPAGSTEPAEYVRTCDAHGGGYLEIPGSDACIKFSGDVRTRYHFEKAGSDDPAGRLDARGLLSVNGKRNTGFGTASATVAIAADGEGVSVDTYNASLGGLKIGDVNSPGEITFGAYAANVSHGPHDISHGGPGIGYSLDVGFGTSINVAVIKPSGGSKVIPDIGAGIALSQGWGSISVGGGAISFLDEGNKYDTTHADYDALTDTEKAGLDDPADLTGLGFYAGGGAEIPIPGLSSTKIGLTGFFVQGAISKIGVGSIDVYKRVPGCTGENCTQPTGAGRPLYKAGVNTSALPAAHVGNAGTAEDPIYYATAAALSHADFDPEDIQTETLFGADYTVGQPDEPAMGEGHINEIKLNSGFSANGGLTHSFSSDIALHVNGGFFSASEGDYSQTGFNAGGSFDYSPVPGTKFSIGGEFASASVSHGGEATDPIKTQFDADEQSFDPSWIGTFSISQSF